MFNVKLRDMLLFDSEEFTYGKRYFWAYNSLDIINDSIKSMISAYHDTFDEDFWAARHSTLWPHMNPGSPEGQRHIVKLQALRSELEGAVTNLEVIHEKNEGVRRKIRDLREQLLSGCSAEESRRAVEQGFNIRILTMVSMIFLPLTFAAVSPIQRDATDASFF